MNDIQELINIAGMTADAIKNGKLVWVVRCKDCKHQVDNGRRYKDCDIHFLRAKDEWFCADGERQEGR